MTSNGKALWPAPLRPIGRTFLRMWSKSGRKGQARYDAIERLGPKLAASRMEARLPDGSIMLCDFNDLVQRQIYFGGLYEPVECYLFLKLLSPGMTVVDVGANCGQYTLLGARAVGPGGAVHSFEPVAATFEVLKENVELNHVTNVTLNQAALWNETAELSLGGNDVEVVGSGGYSAGLAAKDPSAVKVRAIRFDDYVREHALERIDLIKMDIEGAEPFMLDGARESIERFHPVFLMEVNREALSRMNWTPERLWEWMRTRGYRAFEIGPSPRRSGARTDFTGLGFSNVIFHFKDLPEGIASGWDRRPVKKWACSGW